MITRVVMPKLTDTMEEGVLVTWKKEENDVVAAGDILAEIETDKAVMDLEAFGSGFLRKKLAGEGETVKAGALIAVVAELDDDIEPVLSEVSHDGGGSSVPVTRPPAPVKEFSPPPSGKEKLPNTATEPPQQTVSVKASPRAKAKAKEFGIDLSNIKGSGPRGRIVEEDISELIKGDTILEAQTTDRPLSQIRKAIARTQAKLTQKTSLSMTTLFVKSVALALSRHPDINASFHGDSIRQHGRIDIGVAVALEDGLVTPVIRDCVRKDIFELSKEIQILIDRSRQKQLLPEEYTGATFSISNLGMYQVENFIAVLVPPQAASLAIGAIQSVPVADGELIKIDRRMKITLSCDHRALDGAQGAKFLQTFKYILEHPLQLFLSTTS
jgi:pyruvate dehydrogenase E2 component (dihydrolipoamide acetyltransferase)